MHDLSSLEYVGGFSFSDEGGLTHIERLTSGGGESRPPIYHHSGLNLVSTTPGSSEFVLPVPPRWRTREGEVPPAASIFLCDAPLGIAVLSILPPDQSSPTAELSIFYLEPVPREATKLTTIATLVHQDGNTGFAEADIRSDDGTMVARAASRIAISQAPPMVMPPTVSLPDGFVSHSLREEGLDGPEHPYLDLHWMETLAVNPSIAILRMVTRGWHLSAAANLYGGTLAVLAQAAADALAEAAAPEGHRAVALDLKVQYPRPIGPGETLVAEARIVHGGRRMFFGEVFIRRDDGKIVTLGTSTHRFAGDQ